MINGLDGQRMLIALLIGIGNTYYPRASKPRQ